MADEQPLEELMEQGEENADAEEAPKPASRFALPPLRKIIIFAVIACVSIGAAYAVTIILSAPPAKPDDENAQGAAGTAEEPREKPKKEASEGSAIFHSMESIIVNLAGVEGRRYLKATMVFKLKNQQALKSIEEHRVSVVDKLNMLLSSKKIEDIDGSEKKIEVKREIRDELNNLLGIKDAILEVLFTEFIIQ